MKERYVGECLVQAWSIFSTAAPQRMVSIQYLLCCTVHSQRRVAFHPAKFSTS